MTALKYLFLEMSHGNISNKDFHTLFHWKSAVVPYPTGKIRFPLSVINLKNVENVPDFAGAKSTIFTKLCLYVFVKIIIKEFQIEYISILACKI